MDTKFSWTTIGAIVAIFISVVSLFVNLLLWCLKWTDDKKNLLSNKNDDKEKLLGDFLSRYPAVQVQLNYLAIFTIRHPGGKLWEALQIPSTKYQASNDQESLRNHLAAWQSEKDQLDIWAKVDKARFEVKEYWDQFYKHIDKGRFPDQFGRRTPFDEVDLIDYRDGGKGEKWLNRADTFRVLVEPFDIVNWYRMGLDKKGSRQELCSYINNGRPGIYIKVQNAKIARLWETNATNGEYKDALIWAYAKERPHLCTCPRPSECEHHPSNLPPTSYTPIPANIPLACT